MELVLTIYYEYIFQEIIYIDAMSNGSVCVYIPNAILLLTVWFSKCNSFTVLEALFGREIKVLELNAIKEAFMLSKFSIWPLYLSTVGHSSNNEKFSLD